MPKMARVSEYRQNSQVAEGPSDLEVTVTLPMALDKSNGCGLTSVHRGLKGPRRHSNAVSTHVPETSFHILPLTPTTYLIVEDDAYGEHPHIYIKVYPTLLLITDTGCNTPYNPKTPLYSLRNFLETFPVPENGHKPLNPKGEKDYLILCTHCHYDHILGIPPFLSRDSDDEHPDTQGSVGIIASSNGKSFITHNLPKHSLCEYIKVPTPHYRVTHWAKHLSHLTHQPTTVSPTQSCTTPTPLRIQSLHTPGHTPDSLSWYDMDEARLYVGDTFYARKRTVSIPGLPKHNEGVIPGMPEDVTNAAIIFPEEGDWIAYMASLEMLLEFVRFRNAELLLRRRGDGVSHDWVGVGGGSGQGVVDVAPTRVKVCSGHITVAEDAERVIVAVVRFFEDIIAGRVPVKESTVRRGVLFDFWEHFGEEDLFDVLAPRKLVDDIRRFRETQLAAVP